MTKKVNTDLASVNDGLYDDLFIQKLENRLETDPLAVGGLVDLLDQSDFTGDKGCLCNHCFFACGEKG